MRPVRSQDELAGLARAVLAHVQYQRTLGAVGVPASTAAGPTDAEDAPVPSVACDATPTPGTLDDLRADIGDCRRCKLAPHRTHLVFGVGNPRARVAFVGEAPGADEDARGEPFVGRAGQLLTEIITKGMRLRRDDVYICNVIK